MLELRVYKNFRELCEELNWKVGTGKQKKLQLEELSRLCNWHKEGNKIVIDEIFEVAKEKVDGRINNKNQGHSTKSTKEDDKRANNGNNGHSTSKYEMIDTLIYNQLSDGYRIFTKKQLIKNAGLYVSKDTINNGCDVNEYSVNDFLDVYNSTISKLIDTSLNRMSKNGVIEYSKVIVIDNSLNVVELDSKVCKVIEDIENEIAKDMNVKNVFLLSEQDKKLFYNKCNEKAIEMGVCFDYYYRAYRITKINDFDKYSNTAKEELLNKLCKSIKKSKTFKSKIEDAQNKFDKIKESMTNDDDWGESIYDTFGEEIILEQLSKAVRNRLSKNYNSDINSIIKFIINRGN